MIWRLLSTLGRETQSILLPNANIVWGRLDYAIPWAGGSKRRGYSSRASCDGDYLLISIVIMFMIIIWIDSWFLMPAWHGTTRRRGGEEEGMTTAELWGGKNTNPAGHTMMIPSGMMMSAPQYQSLLQILWQTVRKGMGFVRHQSRPADRPTSPTVVGQCKRSITKRRVSNERPKFPGVTDLVDHRVALAWLGGRWKKEGGTVIRWAKIQYFNLSSSSVENCMCVLAVTTGLSWKVDENNPERCPTEGSHGWVMVTATCQQSKNEAKRESSWGQTFQSGNMGHFAWGRRCSGSFGAKTWTSQFITWLFSQRCNIGVQNDIITFTCTIGLCSWRCG